MGQVAGRNALDHYGISTPVDWLGSAANVKDAAMDLDDLFNFVSGNVGDEISGILNSPTPPIHSSLLGEWQRSKAGRNWATEQFLLNKTGRLRKDQQKDLMDYGAFSDDLAREAAYYNDAIKSGAQEASLYVRSRGVEVPRLGNFMTRDIPVVDWDWPDEAHTAPGQTTIGNLNDVVERVADYASDNKRARMQLYLTPGGIHGIETGYRANPGKFYGLFSSTLNPDPYYEALSLMDQGDGMSYRLRTTPKASRLKQGTDFVAHYLGSIGEGKINPYIMEEVIDNYSDPAIRNVEKLRRYGYADPTPHALRMAETQLKTIKSPSIRKLLGR